MKTLSKIILLVILTLLYGCGESGSSSDGNIATEQTPEGYEGQKKAVLLHGMWYFSYTIIFRFDETFVFPQNLYLLYPPPDEAYYMNGIDKFGYPVVAVYTAKTDLWNLLDHRNIIDLFFVFKIDGTTILPGGCYYQILVSTGAMSVCFPLAGRKVAESSALARQVGGENVIPKVEINPHPDPEIIRQYQILRGVIKQEPQR